MKRAYYYLFYKFYRMSEAAPSRWLSDWKAGIFIIALELFFIASIVNYYAVFINRADVLSDIGLLPIIICVLLIVVPNYIAFVHNDIWKGYVKEFDQMPKRQNAIGSWIVWGVVLLVIANFIFSFYLYYEN